MAESVMQTLGNRLNDKNRAILIDSLRERGLFSDKPHTNVTVTNEELVGILFKTGKDEVRKILSNIDELQDLVLLLEFDPSERKVGLQIPSFASEHLKGASENCKVSKGGTELKGIQLKVLEDILAEQQRQGAMLRQMNKDFVQHKQELCRCNEQLQQNQKDHNEAMGRLIEQSEQTKSELHRLVGQLEEDLTRRETIIKELNERYEILALKLEKSETNECQEFSDVDEDPNKWKDSFQELESKYDKLRKEHDATMEYDKLNIGKLQLRLRKLESKLKEGESRERDLVDDNAKLEKRVANLNQRLEQTNKELQKVTEWKRRHGNFLAMGKKAKSDLGHTVNIYNTMEVKDNHLGKATSRNVFCKVMK